MRCFLFLLFILSASFSPAQDMEHINPSTTHVADWHPPAFDTDQIVLADQGRVRFIGQYWDVRFYRNLAYDCGLSGKHSFLIVEPAGGAGRTAPLWMFLHGGGMGYFDDGGQYRALRGQDQHSWNHEETMDDLLRGLHARITDRNGQAEDTTLRRRLQQGYRILMPSLCDHDFYSGQGTAYPNNPHNTRGAGRQVNGLQATQAALAHTWANTPTSKTYLHGTSAGSIGAYSLALSAARRGWQIDGAILDSALISPHMQPILDAYTGHDRFPVAAGFNPEGMIAKVGSLMAPDTAGLMAEFQIAAGFRAVPLMFIVGADDPFCAGHLPTLPIARASGGNCAHSHAGIRAALTAQDNSPHRLLILRSTRHTPTNKAGRVNDQVDRFIR